MVEHPLRVHVVLVVGALLGVAADLPHLADDLRDRLECLTAGDQVVADELLHHRGTPPEEDDFAFLEHGSQGVRAAQLVQVPGLRGDDDAHAHGPAGAPEFLDEQGGLVTERGALFEQPVRLVGDPARQRVRVDDEPGAAHLRVGGHAALGFGDQAPQHEDRLVLRGDPGGDVALGLGHRLAVLQVGEVDDDAGRLAGDQDRLHQPGLPGARGAENDPALGVSGRRVEQAEPQRGSVEVRAERDPSTWPLEVTRDPPPAPHEGRGACPGRPRHRGHRAIRRGHRARCQ
ncbi:hypothetical protein ACFQ6U_33055 [Streptomyces sp. NPDC056465]|uniref:hypothetical protein n=1 Tax=Streptomyces sp. NPDC056465 TaxID=3345829 RepID=UPI0036BC25AF